MIFSNLEHILTHISFSIVSIVITIYLMTLLGMIATFFCITGLLVTRWIYLEHFPLSGLYESLMGAITAPSTIFTQGFATSGLLTKMHQSTILVPALQSQWLMMHVSMMILSYAALLCGSLLSVSLLVITFRISLGVFGKKNHSLIGPFSFDFDEIQYVNERSNALLNNSLLLFRNYHRYQLIHQLDRWSYRVISLGFIFLTIGILSGAVWANEAWGSYWNWDPKETWAFITWTIFAIYLHIRTNQNFQGTNSAIVASMGFLIIWVCYFGVNLLGIGLHSYGSFTLAS
ncbi:hypothetical protein MKW94_020420 [Papaver nudicaule]|uniref:Cytochrome c assembly protein domain-containing protein n=1 Tax=Papaver nudicaule TaxID=74823 RepID=A0AA41VM94_PAPNU|nr:hypothetical protein [Papaver nudicaule]